MVNPDSLHRREPAGLPFLFCIEDSPCRADVVLGKPMLRVPAKEAAVGESVCLGERMVVFSVMVAEAPARLGSVELPSASRVITRRQVVG